MSLKEAFTFILRIRDDPRLQGQLDRNKGLGGVVEMAERKGYRFSVEELRAAFARDAAMRRWHYSGRLEGDPTE